MTSESEERLSFVGKVAEDYTALHDTLRFLVAAAGDTDRNMRQQDGACLDCGQKVEDGHDDPDCGMAGLHAVAQDARRLLANLRVPLPGRPFHSMRLTAADPSDSSSSEHGSAA